MPDTSNYAITYPCMGPVVSLDDFYALATDTEAAIAAVNAEAVAVTHLANMRAFGDTATALGVEAVMLFTGFPAQLTSSGITVNAAAGTCTVVTAGVYLCSAALFANQSTLTMTSQRVAIYVNGVFHSARKYRGFNPATTGALIGSYDMAVGPLAVGDVVTFRYLWTGTGALSGSATARVSMNLIATT